MSPPEKKIILTPIGDGLYPVLKQIQGDIHEVYGLQTDIIILM